MVIDPYKITILRSLKYKSWSDIDKMNYLSIEGISKKYSEKNLLNNINLGISEGDKIGLIGVNGTGKSTLLKIIAGAEEPDEGRIIKGNSIRIEYLSQNPYFDEGATVIEQVFKGNSSIMKVIRDYYKAIADPNISNEKIIQLTNNMDTISGWDLEKDAKTVLTKLGIEDFHAKIGTLSGGQKKRIALASALINPCELLILDEPTNHLDNESIDWLEEYLNGRKGALLMITHDRYFLDRVVNQIIEIDRGSIYTYKGNYSYYLEKKLEREEQEIIKEKKRQSLYKKELSWIKTGARARTTKQKARINRFEDLKERAQNIDSEKMDISVASSRLGKKIIEIEKISKAFDKDKKVIDNFSYILLRDDRIGIVGHNGSGKSTLLNIIYGKIKPDNGTVDIGETVKIGMFSQETYHVKDDLRVIEYIKEGADYIRTSNGDRISASQMLERFLFPPEAQWTLISKLSGGEKRRLYLLRVLMESPNVLFLDEPTNDLDIETLRILEDYIEEFEGVVVVVSHDRYFLDRITNKIFEFQGNGKIKQYTGNYTQFKNDKSDSEKTIKKTRENKSTNIASEDKSKSSKKSLKFSYNEQREYEKIDDDIAKLEEQISYIQNKIDNAATNYILLQELMEEKKKLEEELDYKMERWVYLNELANKIESIK